VHAESPDYGNHVNLIGNVFFDLFQCREESVVFFASQAPETRTSHHTVEVEVPRDVNLNLLLDFLTRSITLNFYFFVPGEKAVGDECEDFIFGDELEKTREQ